MWALFDDAESSVYHTIKTKFKDKFILYSIGINNKKLNGSKYLKYKKIDLSLLNFNLISDLNTLDKPDIILASPPCESWSGADCNGKMFKSIDKNGNWKVNNSIFYDNYNKNCHPVKTRHFLQKEKSRLLGEATIGATIFIIQHYKPKVWVIENPQTSKTWDFQKYHWNFYKDTFLNLTYYSAYDKNFSKKPTFFKSNIELNLKKVSTTSNKNHMAKGSYAKRSSIPVELIEDIINQIINSEKFKKN